MGATIIGLIGSLRRGSYNASLLRAVAELSPDDVTIEPVSIREIPLYDVFDAEGRLIDDAVRARATKFVAALAEFVQRSRRDGEGRERGA